MTAERLLCFPFLETHMVARLFVSDHRYPCRPIARLNCARKSEYQKLLKRWYYRHHKQTFLKTESSKSDLERMNETFGRRREIVSCVHNWHTLQLAILPPPERATSYLAAAAAFRSGQMRWGKYTI